MDNNKDEENIGSFYMGRVRPPPEPKRLLPPGVLTIIALAALGGIVWYAYPRGAEKYTNMDVPVVKADTAPIKAAPVDPGGMEVRHQDSTVFDPLEKNSGHEVEKLLPTPEQPMDKDQAIKAVEAKPPVVPSTVPPQLDMQMKDAGNGAEKIVPKVEEVKPAPVAQPPKPAVQPPKMAMANAAPIVTAAPAPVVTPAPAPTPAPSKAVVMKVAPKAVADDTAEDDQPVAAKKPAVHAAAAATASGTQYEVQLGSYRESADAKKDWDRFKKKYASYLGKLTMRLVKADIPGKGIYYRLRAGTVSKDKAHEICSALKTHPGGCILAKR